MNKGTRNLILKFDKFLSRYLPDYSITAEGKNIADSYEWSQYLVDKLDDIHAEAQLVLDHFQGIPNFGDTATVGAGGQKGNPYAVNWKIYPMKLMHRELEGGLELTETRKALDKIPGLVNAMFSILPPGSNLAPHEGTSRGLIRGHLGLVIPKESDKCYFIVDNHKHVWQKGEFLIFDQTFTHSAVNSSDEHRVILLIDVIQKDLPFLIRKFLFMMTYILGGHPDSRQTLANYREALKDLKNSRE